MLNFIDTSNMDQNTLDSVLKDMQKTIEKPKQTRADELAAEAKILKQLYDFFAVPSNLLRINPISPVNSTPTEYFAITLPDGSTLNAMDQVLARVVDRVVFEMEWTEKTFRGRKDPKNVLMEKLKAVQKGETYLYKNRLSDLCIELEGLTERIGISRERLIYHVQNLRKLEQEKEIAESILPKKILMSEMYLSSLQNPDVLDSIREYMEAALPKVDIEILNLRHKITSLSRGIDFITKDAEDLNRTLNTDMKKLKELLNSKPISLWPKQDKKDWRMYKKRHI